MKQIQSGRRVDGQVQPTTHSPPRAIAAAAPWAWEMSMREGAWAESRQTLVLRKKSKIAYGLDIWVSKQCAIHGWAPHPAGALRLHGFSAETDAYDTHRVCVLARTTALPKWKNTIHMRDQITVSPLSVMIPAS